MCIFMTNERKDDGERTVLIRVKVKWIMAAGVAGCNSLDSYFEHLIKRADENYLKNGAFEKGVEIEMNKKDAQYKALQSDMTYAATLYERDTGKGFLEELEIYRDAQISAQAKAEAKE